MASGRKTIFLEDHFLILFMDVSATVSCVIYPRVVGELLSVWYVTDISELFCVPNRFCGGVSLQ